ncbi:MAG: LysE family transporter [bacterium]
MFGPLFAIFGSAFIIGLSGAMMPGPVTTMVVDEARKGGVATGPLVALGHAALELSLVLAIYWGFGKFFTHPIFKGAVGILGGGILLYMGIGMIRSAGRASFAPDLSKSDGGSDPRFRSPFANWLRPPAMGLLTSLSNPYWIIWWATIGLAYMNLALDRGRIGLAFFYAGHVSSDFIWLTLVASAVALGRKFVSDRVFHYIIAICGIALLGFGLCFGYSGIRALLPLNT